METKTNKLYLSEELKKLTEENELYKRMLDKFGDLQMVVAVEELSELQKEVCKAMRGKCNKEHLVEEVADVTIMIGQIMLHYAIQESEVQQVIKEKLKRTEERFNKGEI